MLSVHTNTTKPEKGHAENSLLSKEKTTQSLPELWGLRESTHPLTTLRRRTWADGKK